MCSKLLDGRLWGLVFLGLIGPLVIASEDAAAPALPQLSGAPGCRGATGGTVTDIGVVCTEIDTPDHCQLPDQLGHGGAGVVGVVSDKTFGPTGIAAAERVANESGTTRHVIQVCWWGAYWDGNAEPPDCSDDPAIAGESFEITIYFNETAYVPGCPTSVPDGLHTSFTDVPVTKAPTGNTTGGLVEYEYTTTLPASVALDPGMCYWIEIQNDTTGTVSNTCHWIWTTAPPGDGVSAQDVSGDGVYVQVEVYDFDLAVCLDVALGDTSICDPEFDPLCAGAEGYCGTPHPEPGCADPCCCSLVCGIDPTCCTAEWTQACADTAIGEGCAILGYPVCMATGDDLTEDGYLEVCADAYGGWSSPSFGGLGDRFNPVGDLTDQEVAFTSGLFIFSEAAGQRELLSTDDQWQATFGPDTSLNREVTAESVESDTNGDGVTDALASSFRVTGVGVDLTFDLDQSVDRIDDGAGGVYAVVTQTYVISNNLFAAIDFELLRVLDGDLLWSGDFGDDSVGTCRATAADSVFIKEEADWATAVGVSSADANGYFGAKNGIDPDGPGPGPAMGYGTSTEAWEAYGIPLGWENYIAGVEYDTSGESGAAPDNCQAPCDAHIGLRVPLSIGPSGEVTITIEHEYGSPVCSLIGFNDPEKYAADGVPTIHALGDLYGDGTTDVAAVIPDESPVVPGTVQVFKNLGVGSSGQWCGLRKIQDTIDVGLEPSGIVLGLFDGDQLLDMAVTNAGGGDVWIFLNVGNATFGSPPQQIATGNRPSAITAGQYNPTVDAFVDLAVTNEADDDVVILFGSANGTFARGAGAGTSRADGIGVDQSPVAILSDDFDNNDDDDLTGASRGTAGAAQTATAFVLLSNGDGTFQTPVSYDIGDDPKDVSSGDLSRDGWADIVTANADAADSVTVLVNQGDGTFVPADVTSGVGPNPLSIEAVDLDNDLDHDLAVVAEVDVAGEFIRFVQVLENVIIPPADVSFGIPLNLEVGTGAEPNFVVAGDLNADGLADLVTVNEEDSAGSVTVLLGSRGLVPPWTPCCPCDCEDPPDGTVDAGDFLALLSQWGGPGSCDCQGEPDGIVNVGDFLALLAGWGSCP